MENVHQCERVETPRIEHFVFRTVYALLHSIIFLLHFNTKQIRTSKRIHVFLALYRKIIDQLTLNATHIHKGTKSFEPIFFSLHVWINKLQNSNLIRWKLLRDEIKRVCLPLKFFLADVFSEVCFTSSRFGLSK